MPSRERIKIAQDLHDGIAQDLVGVGYSLDLLLSNEALSTQARSDIRATRFAVDELISKVRSEILNLRQGTGRPLHAEIQSLAVDICTGFELEFHLDNCELPLQDHYEILAIATEILRNCVAHSRATRVCINLYSVNNRTCLEVIDNGIGGADVKEGRFGMLGLKERVQALGGSITIESIEGTRIAILL
jgi:NarL family two-component system sensor histidine kinase LiaS